LSIERPRNKKSFEYRNYPLKSAVQLAAKGLCTFDKNKIKYVYMYICMYACVCRNISSQSFISIIARGTNHVLK